MLSRILAIVSACFLTAACGGGGGGGGSSSASTSAPASSTPPVSTPVTVAPLTNFTTVTVDGGPAALSVGPNASTADNSPFVSVTICAPGSTTNCQTIDHVLLDTGSVGLRLVASVVNASLLAALPVQTSAASNPVGECYGYVDGYVFGSVRQADFQIGGETVAGMPLQLIGDTGVFSTVPQSCSSGGGMNLNTVQTFGANGVIGVGLTATDCGGFCATSGGSGAATYYDCPSTGCSTIIARASSTTAPFQQLPNPVAAMSVDNNGTIIVLPAAPAGGEASMTGTVYFGIGTQTNNTLGSATVLTTTTSTSNLGSGLLTVIYNGQTLSESFLDSGTNFYVFVDNSITACTSKDLLGYYCPSPAQPLSPTVRGLSGNTASAAFTLNNAQSLVNTGFAVLPGIGGNPDLFNNLTPVPNSFGLGLPFFYGKSVYTAIEGRNAGGTVGPYFAY